MTDETSGYNRKNARSIRKIKSPSNSFTQFYKEGVLVGIECTSRNSRRISGEIIIEGTPIDNIWNILTDYDNLSTHVPNLMESRVINTGSTPRVYQRGAQRIFGFEFGADVTMDMTEYIHHGQYENEPKMYSIDFECVNSQFFSEFDGSWILEEYSNNKTMVRYIVDVRPKGPVPVAALEWRIKEDVPVNILAVSKSARASGAARREEERQNTLEASPQVEQQSLHRIRQASQQPQPNLLQQLTDQATSNFEQTAKAFLPAPLISTARQAIEAVNKSNPMVRAPWSRQNMAASESLDDIGQKTKTLKDLVIVDWYEDETMATYLKDS